MNKINPGEAGLLLFDCTELPSRKLMRSFGAGRGRRGTAAVEFAVVFPIFLLLVFGAIDVGRALMAQHKLVEAARAGCRLYAIKEGATEAEARAVVDQVMADANLDGYAAELDPDKSDSIEHLQPVTVSVSIPYDNVSWLPSWFLAGRTLTGTCIMPGDTGEILRDDHPEPPQPPPHDDDDDKDKGKGGKDDKAKGKGGKDNKAKGKGGKDNKAKGKGGMGNKDQGKGGGGGGGGQKDDDDDREDGE